MSDSPQSQPAPTPATQQPHEQVVKLPFPLQDGERIIQLTRRHWWYLWPMSLLYLLYGIAPPVILSVILDAVGLLDDLGNIWWGIVVLWLAYWAVRILLNYYRYHNDIWLVTNQRLIDSYKPNPLSLKVASADLVNVQDIRIEKRGITPTMLNYGTVICETAGAGTDEFVISGVPHPEALQLLIDKERDRERTRVGRTGV
jgi:hypothetical protein